MSIEFKADIGKELSDESVVRLKTYILGHSTSKIVRESDAELGLGADSEDTNCRNLELIRLSIGKDHIYLAFHTYSRSERESFINVLKDALAHEGIIADFREL